MTERMCCNFVVKPKAGVDDQKFSSSQRNRPRMKRCSRPTFTLVALQHAWPLRIIWIFTYWQAYNRIYAKTKIVGALAAGCAFWMPPTYRRPGSTGSAWRKVNYRHWRRKLELERRGLHFSRRRL